jgi:hypothetical protein
MQRREGEVMAPPNPTPRIPGPIPRPGPIHRPNPIKGDLVVRFDSELPSDDELTSLGLDAAAIEAAHQVNAHKTQIAARVVSDRQFAGDFARDPEAAVTESGGVRSSTPAPVLDRVFPRIRFQIPSSVVEPILGHHGTVGPGVLWLAPDFVARELLAQVIAQASVSDATWTAFRASPDALVGQVVAGFDWRFLQGGASAGASIAHDVIAALRTTFGLTATSGTPVVAPSEATTTVVVTGA